MKEAVILYAGCVTIVAKSWAGQPNKKEINSLTILNNFLKKADKKVVYMTFFSYLYI